MILRRSTHTSFFVVLEDRDVSRIVDFENVAVKQRASKTDSKRLTG